MIKIFFVLLVLIFYCMVVGLWWYGLWNGEVYCVGVWLGIFLLVVGVLLLYAGLLYGDFFGDFFC